MMRILRKKAVTKAAARQKKDDEFDKLIASVEESRLKLHELATDTKEIAASLALKLRSELMDKMQELDVTASIMNDSLIICDESGFITRMNSNAEALIQRSIETSPDLNISEHFIVDEGIVLEKLIDTPTDVKIIRADGARAFGVINAAKLDMSAGSTQYLIVITSEGVESATVVNMPRGTIMVSNGLITAVSPEIESLMGFARDEVFGHMFIELLAPSERDFVDGQILDKRLESTFDTTLMTKQGSKLFCKMSVGFFNQTDNCVVTVENVGDDVMDRKVDVLRCFGEDFFFRSASTIAGDNDMIMFLSPDLRITFMNEAMKRFYSIDYDPTGLLLENAINPNDFKVASLHLMSLKPADPERTITLQLNLLNDRRFQEWTDRATFDENDNVLEYRRTGRSR